MIKLDLRSINLYDGDFDAFVPEIEGNFHKWIDLDIGIEWKPVSSIFSFCVCSPRWIAHNCSKEGFFWGTRTLIIEKFDHTTIRKEIDQILECCSKDTWELSVANLLKFFSWEFEDYNQ